jgi:hypothetical protein
MGGGSFKCEILGGHDSVEQLERSEAMEPFDRLRANLWNDWNTLANLNDWNVLNHWNDWNELNFQS